jgi:hypothetical protein
VIAVYILFCAIVSIIATALLPDYTNRGISGEVADDRVGAASAAPPPPVVE